MRLLFSQFGAVLVCLLAFTSGAPTASGQKIELAKATPQELYKVATEHLTAAHYNEAVPWLAKLLDVIQKDKELAGNARVKPVWEWAQYFLGLAYLETNRPDESKKALEAYLARFPLGQYRDSSLVLLAEVAAAKKQWDEVINRTKTLLQKTELMTDLKLNARQLLGEALFRQGKWNDALEQLPYVYTETRNIISRNQAAGMIITCLIELEKYQQLFDFLPGVYRTSARFDAGVNVGLLEGGDTKYQSGKYEYAILLYRWVMFKTELLREVTAELAEAKRDMKDLETMTTAQTPDLPAQKRKQTRLINNLEDQLKRLNEFPDYDQELVIRQARTYLELKRYWEALLLFRSVYDDYPQHKLAEQGLYFAFTTALAMKQENRALTEGYEYVQVYPQGEYWDWITVGLAELHNQRKEYEKTVDSGGKWLAQKPNHTSGDYLNYLVGYAEFQLEFFEKALGHFGTVITKYPNSAIREPCQYWHAMTQLFLARYPDARKEFQVFLEKYPKGYYTEDSAYRLGVAYYGENDYVNCAKALKDFVEKFPQSPSRSEAFAMLGDVAAAAAKLDDAVDYYRKAIDCAINMQQRNFATFQMARVFELESRYDEIIALFKDYIAKWGETGNITEATYWIGNSQMRSGHPKEAVQTFFNAIVTYGNNPAAFGVDMILRDILVEVGQTLSPEDRRQFMDNLYEQIGIARRARKTTLELRLIALFAERMPDGPTRESMVTSILRDANITNASPLTLLLMGRQATRHNQPAFARSVYDQFMDKYVATDFALEALKAISDMKISEGHYDEARKLLASIIERFATCPDAAWAQKATGDTYRLEKNYAEAIKAYNLVLGVKDWRGPLWPEALYWIGICNLEQDNAKEAFPFFQRVYVMYEGYPAWVAKAYVQSAICLEKIGQTADAIKTYQEMIANETLATTPEIQQARQSLKRLEGKS